MKPRSGTWADRYTYARVFSEGERAMPGHVAVRVLGAVGRAVLGLQAGAGEIGVAGWRWGLALPRGAAVPERLGIIAYLAHHAIHVLAAELLRGRVGLGRVAYGPRTG